MQTADASIELFRDFLQMLVDERLDVSLVARLRPATLVMPSGRLVELVDELLELSGAQDVDGSTLPADHGDQRSLTTADERDERGKVELPTHSDLVGDRIAEGQRSPRVVESRAEDRHAAGTVAVEIALEELSDPSEVTSERFPLLVRQLMGGLRPNLPLVHQGVDPAGRVTGGRRDARIEIDVDADRAPLLGAEARQLAEPVPTHRCGHLRLLAGKPRL